MDYSLLVMASVKMMKMATGDGFPSIAGYWNASRLVFHRYRELRRRNGESRVILLGFPNIWEFIGIGGGGRGARGAQPPPGRARGPLARPGGCCLPWARSSGVLWPIWFLLVRKKSTKIPAAFHLCLVLIYCEVKNQKKQQLALGTKLIG